MLQYISLKKYIYSAHVEVTIRDNNCVLGVSSIHIIYPITNWSFASERNTDSCSHKCRWVAILINAFLYFFPANHLSTSRDFLDLN